MLGNLNAPGGDVVDQVQQQIQQRIQAGLQAIDGTDAAGFLQQLASGESGPGAQTPGNQPVGAHPPGNQTASSLAGDDIADLPLGGRNDYRPAKPEPSPELAEAFQDFVGQTFFGQMLKSLRSTQQPSKYFHGGRAEEIFQGQFDQEIAARLSDASGDKFSGPMLDKFMIDKQA